MISRLPLRFPFPFPLKGPLGKSERPTILSQPLSRSVSPRLGFTLCLGFAVGPAPHKFTAKLHPPPQRALRFRPVRLSTTKIETSFAADRTSYNGNAISCDLSKSLVCVDLQVKGISQSRRLRNNPFPQWTASKRNFEPLHEHRIRIRTWQRS
ncbi:hypothetical protein PDE_00565 [Penicillium oxalicum 114-2]|uniref:Uncharacterized protein n=1 Tax=Penicillium oxalicum (strain 114-2 / CGMCC 5302) TaxID=933388 RepID=S7ZAB9_PENO1|nr:hypothetical protein PDE_00565 [Penicillium oxalicum 114-2]